MTAATLLTIAEYWLIIGAICAAVFLTFGIDRIDEDARGSYIFRPLLVPGVMLIWPLVLWRWQVLERERDNWKLRHLPERKAHTAIWSALCLVLPLIVLLGLAVRQTPPDGAPIKLEEAR